MVLPGLLQIMQRGLKKSPVWLNSVENWVKIVTGLKKSPVWLNSVENWVKIVTTQVNCPQTPVTWLETYSYMVGNLVKLNVKSSWINNIQV